MKKHIKQNALSLLTLFLISGCGMGIFGDDDKNNSGAGDSAENASEEGEELNTGPETQIVFSVTAEYENPPVDVLVLKENSGTIHSNQNPFSKRLYVSNNDVTRAYQEFAVRLYFSKLDFKLGFLESMFNNDEEMITKAGHLLKGIEGDPVAFDANATNFVDEVVERSNTQPGAEVSEGAQRNNPNFFFPLTSIERFLKNNAEETSSSNGFLRDGALLSILFVGISDPIKESRETSEIIELLDESRGAGNWIVNVLGAPKEGCEYTKTDETKIHTNQGQYYANSDDPSVFLEYKRRNKMVKLQEASGGIFQNICEEDYVEFMRKVVTEGTKTAFFSVSEQFEREVIEGSLEVLVNGNPIEGWQFRTATQTLLLPTTIPTGTIVEIKYKTPAKEGDKVIESPVEQTEEIPDIEEVELSPAELAWINNIRTIFQNNGCISCHGEYNEFEGAWNARNQVLQRITLDESDPLSMPQNSSFDSAVNRQAVIDWIEDN